jgi:thiosulfate/3-mercaptopyruvate sulfurtransferase
MMLMVGLVAGCATPAAEQKPAEKPAAGAMTSEEMAAVAEARTMTFISVADLAKNPTKFTIVDTRDAKAYAAGHIEGAINAPWQTFSSVTVGKPGDANWGTLLPASDIAAALGKLGIDPTKMTVTYADPTGWGEDGRVAWTMNSIGIENVLMLDGGYPSWTAAGNKTATTATTLPATAVSVVSDNLANINVTTEQVKKATEDSSAILVDTRSKKEFDGAVDYGEKRGGHIPGAINIPFSENFNEDGTVKSDEDLMALYMDAGIPMDATAYSYCTKGIRSAYVQKVLTMLQFKTAKNYDASFYSWAGDSTLPVAK